MHIRLTSDAKINYEVYTRFGGLPSLTSWDYYYANMTSNSVGSMFFNLYNSSEDKVDFYILYVREGTWGFGLRHLDATSIASKVQTTMSLSLERCPRRCSSHGKCQDVLDASGLTSYRFMLNSPPTKFPHLPSFDFLFLYSELEIVKTAREVSNPKEKEKQN